MLLGVAVIAVPLLVAIFNAALQMQQLADATRIVTAQGIGAARASEDLMSEVLILERATRLYQVTADAKYLDLYRDHDVQLTRSRVQLTRQLRSAASAQALGQLGALQTSLAKQVLGAASNNATVGAALAQFSQVGALAERIAVQSKVEIDAQITDIENRTSRSQKLLLWQSGLLIPLRCSPS